MGAIVFGEYIVLQQVDTGQAGKSGDSSRQPFILVRGCAVTLGDVAAGDLDRFGNL
jgi:hypothetical protein